MGLQAQQYLWLHTESAVDTSALLNITQPESPMTLIHDFYRDDLEYSRYEGFDVNVSYQVFLRRATNQTASFRA